MNLFSFGAHKDDAVRKAAVAGTFYPWLAEELRRDVRAYLDQAEVPELPGTVLAALAPHAGYSFSARLAAPVHRAIAAVPFDTLVVIGHDFHAAGLVALLTPAKTFQTPLGNVPVDTALAKALAAHDPRIVYHPGAHTRDHTIEVHLPFLQVMERKCHVLPVLFGEPTEEHCAALAEALRACAGKRRLFILASTDLCHFPNADDARELDRQTIEKVTALDLPALFAHLAKFQSGDRNIQTAMCAAGGVGTAMLFAKARGADSFQTLQTANSADVSRDDSRVVGYAAGLFLKSAAKTAAPAFDVPETVRRELLALARHRIRTAAAGETLDYTPPHELREHLETPAAVFVTLHKNRHLRGCIGTTTPRDPLWRAVHELAHSAAFRDPRFPPVTAAEVPDLHLEISVLSPLQPVPDADAILPRTHGVVVRQGYHCGLFLPQVWDQIPDKDQFLTILCQEKAHLPGNAWRDGNAELSVFTVCAFAEEG